MDALFRVRGEERLVRVEGGVEVATSVVGLSAGALASTAGAAAVGDVAQDAGEEAVAAPSVATAGTTAQDLFGADDVLEGVVTVGADEGVAGDVLFKVVLVVEAAEEELATAVLGAGTLASGGDDVLEGGAVLTFEGMGRGAGAADAEEDADEERDERASEVRPAQGGDGVGEAVGEREEQGERVLHRAKRALERGLLGRRRFLLRLVVHAEPLARLARGLGEVRRALVDEELRAGQAGERLGDGLDDEVGVLLLADGEGGEEIPLSASRVLCGDEPQVDAEGADVRRVREGLQVGRAQLEGEAALPARARRRRRGRRVRGARRGGRTTSPRAEGALGDPEGGREAAPADAVLGAESLGGGDETVLQPGIPDTALGDHGRRDGELGLGDGETGAQSLGVAVGGAAPAAMGAGDEILEGREDARLEAREGLGRRIALGAQRRDGTGEPATVEGRDDGGAHEGEKTAWRSGSVLRG